MQDGILGNVAVISKISFHFEKTQFSCLTAPLLVEEAGAGYFLGDADIFPSCQAVFWLGPQQSCSRICGIWAQFSQQDIQGISLYSSRPVLALCFGSHYSFANL